MHLYLHVTDHMFASHPVLYTYPKNTFCLLISVFFINNTFMVNIVGISYLTYRVYTWIQVTEDRKKVPQCIAYKAENWRESCLTPFFPREPICERLKHLPDQFTLLSSCLLVRSQLKAPKIEVELKFLSIRFSKRAYVYYVFSLFNSKTKRCKLY